ncbi:hypothetical protein HK101_011505, partial [Irineochytrium annulatum]
MNDNSLSGPIPTELGSASSLDEIYLNNNQLSGTIPQSLTSLTGLTYLALHFNQLTGPIPPAFGGMKNLQYLLVNNNELNGTVDGLTGISHFNFASNCLAGIPNGSANAGNQILLPQLAVCPTAVTTPTSIITFTISSPTSSPVTPGTSTTSSTTSTGSSLPNNNGNNGSTSSSSGVPIIAIVIPIVVVVLLALVAAFFIVRRSRNKTAKMPPPLPPVNNNNYNNNNNNTPYLHPQAGARPPADIQAQMVSIAYQPQFAQQAQQYPPQHHQYGNVGHPGGPNPHAAPGLMWAQASSTTAPTSDTFANDDVKRASALFAPLAAQPQDSGFLPSGSVSGA